MGGDGPAWKREIVPDHKFDFVDTREFTDNSFLMRMKYLWLYIVILKSFLVYVGDIFTATTMLSPGVKSWSNQIYNDCATQSTGCFFIPFGVGRWLFVGCIIFGFLLLAYEARKSKRIIASRDISYAFTNIMANHYYSLRSYDHFCFFDHISNSTKKKDDFAFFIFFTFKSWKRLLLSDAPRQTINALTLYSIYLAKKDDGNPWDLTIYFKGNSSFSTTALTVTTFFTVVIFAGSLLLLIAAGIFYIPLLCYIQGNLKEYICHKVDKRIAEVIKRRNKERLAKAAELAKKEAMGDFSHLKNKKGELIAQPLPQPTLPNLSVDDDDFDAASYKKPNPSYAHSDYYYGSDQQSVAPSYHTSPPVDYSNYPPMPGYAAEYGYHGYDDDQGSTVNLAAAAAPVAYQSYGADNYNTYGSTGVAANYVADPHDVYGGRVSPHLVQQDYSAQHYGYNPHDYNPHEYGQDAYHPGHPEQNHGSFGQAM